jgi:hypothetical protein
LWPTSPLRIVSCTCFTPCDCLVFALIQHPLRQIGSILAKDVTLVHGVWAALAPMAHRAVEARDEQR